MSVSLLLDRSVRSYCRKAITSQTYRGAVASYLRNRVRCLGFEPFTNSIRKLKTAPNSFQTANCAPQTANDPQQFSLLQPCCHPFNRPIYTEVYSLT